MRRGKAILVLLSCTLAGGFSFSQKPQSRDSALPAEKPEVLTSGFLDVVNNGQINASARFLRLYIGEPEKFAIPLSIYSGVSANNFQSQGNLRNNDHLVNNFINPLTGMVNLSFEGILYARKARKRITRAGIIYQAGERLLTGVKPSPNSLISGKPINFVNSYGATGLYFQTGAWERNDLKNMGVFWLAARMIGCYSSPRQIHLFLPDVDTNGIYTGCSFGAGIDINRLVNLKLIYYKYLKAPDPEAPDSLYLFTFNYSLKN